MKSELTRPHGSASSEGTWLLLVGAAAFAVAVTAYAKCTVIYSKSYTVDPVDLAVYPSGGLIVRHLRPPYKPTGRPPLYD